MWTSEVESEDIKTVLYDFLSSLSSNSKDLLHFKIWILAEYVSFGLDGVET